MRKVRPGNRYSNERLWRTGGCPRGQGTKSRCMGKGQRLEFVPIASLPQNETSIREEVRTQLHFP